MQGATQSAHRVGEFVIDFGGVADESGDFLAHEFAEALTEALQQLAEVHRRRVEPGCERDWLLNDGGGLE